MNVYDFDNTIYRGDSTVNFYLFCMSLYPDFLFRIPYFHFLKFSFRLITETQLKKRIYEFLSRIDIDIDNLVRAFWHFNKRNIKSWYLNQKKDDDVIISASPEFLLEPICKELGVHLIASKVDKRTGEILSPNNSKEEKVIRFQKEFNLSDIDAFYSDSNRDKYLAKYAKRAYKVKGALIVPWDVK